MKKLFLLSIALTLIGCTSPYERFVAPTLGVSIDVPHEASDGAALVPVLAKEDTAQGLVTIQGQSTSPFGWDIYVVSVQSENELERIIRRVYGDGCRIGEKTPTGQKGVLMIQIDTQAEGMDDPVFAACPINYGVIIFYSPDHKKAVYWDIGQDISFANVGRSEAYDIHMVESFRFE